MIMKDRLRPALSRSQSVLLPGDDPAEYEALLEQLRDHFSPDDPTEDRHVREMADAEWRLRRNEPSGGRRISCGNGCSHRLPASAGPQSAISQNPT